jgi:hypothetical protein
MASLIYDNFLDSLVKGGFNFSTDTIKVLLVTSTFVANKGTQLSRADVTNEVVGTGYTAGGNPTTVTCTKDTTNHREDLTFSNVTWNTATITARAAIIYKSAGGTAAGDVLVAYVDFGQDVSSTAAAFSVTFSSALRFQN